MNFRVWIKVIGCTLILLLIVPFNIKPLEVAEGSSSYNQDSYEVTQLQKMLLRLKEISTQLNDSGVDTSLLDNLIFKAEKELEHGEVVSAKKTVLEALKTATRLKMQESGVTNSTLQESLMKRLTDSIKKLVANINASAFLSPEEKKILLGKLKKAEQLVKEGDYYKASQILKQVIKEYNDKGIFFKQELFKKKVSEMYNKELSNTMQLARYFGLNDTYLKKLEESYGDTSEENLVDMIKKLRNIHVIRMQLISLQQNIQQESSIIEFTNQTMRKTLMHTFSCNTEFVLFSPLLAYEHARYIFKQALNNPMLRNCSDILYPFFNQTNDLMNELNTAFKQILTGNTTDGKIILSQIEEKMIVLRSDLKSMNAPKKCEAIKSLMLRTLEVLSINIQKGLFLSSEIEKTGALSLKGIVLDNETNNMGKIIKVWGTLYPVGYENGRLFIKNKAIIDAPRIWLVVLNNETIIKGQLIPGSPLIVIGLAFDMNEWNVIIAKEIIVYN